MRRKLGYVIAVVVILAGIIGPAVCMHKVFSPRQQSRPADTVLPAGRGSKGQVASGDQDRTAAAKEQISPGVNQGQPVGGTKQNTAAAKGGAASPDTARNGKNGGASREAATASPVVPPLAGGCKVWIAVVGKNHELLFGPAQVMVSRNNKWGVTALGALDATGLPYATKPTWPDFVDSIGGQANSGMAGWMYSVNGEVPMHMADKHPVKTGDKVIWWYSRSMDQPPPRWEDLTGNK